uniref:hypothetical protein n=1 Tax=Rhodococcus qingshengii TaxID=334542 RepID=UPI00211A208C|nr:hypothetical protein [Rhodococcus qingshengii]
MSGSKQLDVGPDLAVLPDHDLCHIEGGEIDVDERTRADMDIAAEVDEQRWADNYLCADRSEYCFQEFRASGSPATTAAR